MYRTTAPGTVYCPVLGIVYDCRDVEGAVRGGCGGTGGSIVVGSTGYRNLTCSVVFFSNEHGDVFIPYSVHDFSTSGMACCGPFRTLHPSLRSVT